MRRILRIKWVEYHECEIETDKNPDDIEMRDVESSGNTFVDGDIDDVQVVEELEDEPEEE